MDRKLKVRGMFSEHCERAIIDALAHTSSVTNISVDLRHGLVSFSHDPHESPLQEIINLIASEGYDIIG
jgi:copper chaperone CopZ